MSKGRQLRALLAGQGIVVAPGAYDAITARIVAHHGFPAVYMTGAGCAASLGYPDYGLVTLSEMAAKAAELVRAVPLPVIADADTGYGNELNVTRTVQEFEARGVAAIQLEDQVTPKRCGHLDGKEVLPREVFLSNIRAAVLARKDPDLVIIARSDARAVVGFEEAIARVNGALAAGADVAFVEAVQNAEELAAVPRLVRGPCLINIVPGGKTPPVDLATAEALGYRLAIVPAVLITATLVGGDAALAQLAGTGMPPGADPALQVPLLFQRLGAAPWDALRARFATPTDAIQPEEDKP